jgi:hypothetical protein
LQSGVSSFSYLFFFCSSSCYCGKCGGDDGDEEKEDDDDEVGVLHPSDIMLTIFCLFRVLNFNCNGGGSGGCYCHHSCYHKFLCSR